jgi:bisphosphoglycerate-dependent phosphoglycerate mutase
LETSSDKSSWGEQARVIIIDSIGQERYQTICKQFKLSPSEQQLLEQLLAEWRPDYSFQEILSIAERHSGTPGIERAAPAWQQITQEASQASTKKRLKTDGRQN